MFKIIQYSRASTIILSLMEDEVGIGSIFIDPKNIDLIPLIKDLVDRFNKARAPEPPQTITR